MFIPKPGKPDYTNPSSFRPISLSSFMLKSLERVVEWEVRNALQGQQALHDGQHAFRPGRSTDSALHRLVSYLENTILNREMTLCAFLDVEGAFSNIALSAIREDLRKKKIPLIISRWIEKMLAQRIIVSERGSCMVTAEVSRGCGQGAITSPIVWCMVIDELLSILTAEGFYIQAYADDVVLAVTGKDQTTITELMQRALNKIASWCQQKGLGVNPSKTQIVLFTKKTKTAPLLLKLSGAELQFSSSVKFLGIYLDSKLLWNVQLDSAVNKARNILWTLKGCYSNTWGVTPKIMRWLYVSCVRPALSYGCLVWWKRVLLVTADDKLNKLQRIGCIAVTGAMRTTPTAALEVMTDLVPLRLHIEGEALLSVHRMKQAGLFSRKLPPGGHAELLLTRRSGELLMPCDRITRKMIFGSVTVDIPEREAWTEGVPPLPDDTIKWYTDGSRMDGLAGAGIYYAEMNVAK